MKNETENVAHVETVTTEKTVRLIWILGAFYRLFVAAGAGALVWHGGSPWVLLAAVPLMFFAPNPNR